MQIVSTPGALDLLEENRLSPQHFLSKLFEGDFGTCGNVKTTKVTDEMVESYPYLDCSDEQYDSIMNVIAFNKREGYVLASYPVREDKLWIIWDFDGEEEIVTVLLPSEY